MGKIDELIKEKPGVAVGALIGFVLLVSALGYVIYQQMSMPVKSKAAAVVEYTDGQNSMKIDSHGLISINTPYGSFSKMMGAEELAQLYAYADSSACNSDTSGSEVVVVISYEDGEQDACPIDDMDEAISSQLQSKLLKAYEEYQLMPTWQHDIYLGQIRQTEGDDYTPIVTPSPVATATPVPGGSANPSPTPVPTNEVISGCEDVLDEATGRKTVVSNVLCIEKVYKED